LHKTNCGILCILQNGAIACADKIFLVVLAEEKILAAIEISRLIKNFINGVKRHAGKVFPRARRSSIVQSALLILCCCGNNTSVDESTLVAGLKEDVYGQTEISAKGSLAEDMPAEAINFGITPWDEPEKLKKMYAPFISYLGEKMKIRIRFVVSQQYQDLVSELKRGIIHIAAFSPGAYADALDEGIDNVATYVASTQNEGNSHYRGLIVTTPEIKNLSALKGKTFAFVEKGSSSGYKFPLALLLAEGIDPYRYFSKVYFLGSHANVVEAIANHKADAGATWDGYLAKTDAFKQKKISALRRTKLIPYDAIVVSRKKGAPFAVSLRRYLLDIRETTKNTAGENVLNRDGGFPYSGYVVHSPTIYDIVRQTSRIVKAYKVPTEKKP